jgi:hypothetical protein
LNEGAECAGGRVAMDFRSAPRPTWLEDDLLGFLAAVDHGRAPFWINDLSTPIWTANVAYDMRLFREDHSLRFDKRYDRIGNVAGGGSDAIMFQALVERGARLRYRPDMAVLHDVEPWRLHRGYFIRLHYLAGIRKRHELPQHKRAYFGIPPFMMVQLARHSAKTVAMYALRRKGRLRQAMNASHMLGLTVGLRRRRDEIQARSVGA